MKIRIQLNIGLRSKTLGAINPIAAVNALTGAGFVLTTYRVTPSTCEDGTEDVLAWQGYAPADWTVQLHGLAIRLGQDCIAYRVEAFAGEHPYTEFDASCWKSPALVNGHTLEDFRSYLLNTIIPDSIEAGFEGYAEDLQTALDFLS